MAGSHPFFLKPSSLEFYFASGADSLENIYTLKKITEFSPELLDIVLCKLEKTFFPQINDGKRQLY